MSNSKSVAWQSPSNIALVKYWGKKGHQIPANPSLSITLSNCHTQTQVYYKEHQGEKAIIREVLVDNVANEKFVPKCQLLLNAVAEDYAILNAFEFSIETKNTFPHGSGIASSASGMSALALCLLEIAVLNGASIENFNQKASYYSRLGSGSACRSIYGAMASWGSTPVLKESSDEYASSFTEFHGNFHDYQDVILLIDKGEKSVSSTAGHALLKNHPYSQVRYEQANVNMVKLVEILTNGDLDSFIDLVEEEALSLHALMMTSSPSYILMKPNTLAVIEKIRAHRKQTGSKIAFTLDAGANVHVLFPASEKETAMSFIDNALKMHCENESYICDQMGNGPVKLK